ncbi:MAG: hypothetical protein HY563_03830, partial [Ignavibacteriales bacterium]|nr:hypothetical protein [Ignavibacteriales bacterium]
RFVVVLFFDVLLLVFCLVHLPSVARRPAAPFEVSGSRDSVLVTRVLYRDAARDLVEGDILLSWNNLRVPLPEAVEFLSDMGTIGGTVPIVVARNGGSLQTSITLVPFYPSPRFLVISTIVGIIVWIIGVFILWNAPRGLTGMVLQWTMMAFAVTILITLGAVQPGDWMSSIDRLLFLFGYMGVVSLFFYFTLIYPTPKTSSNLRAAFWTFVPAIGLAVGLSVNHLLDLRTGSTDYFVSFQTLFDLFHISLFLYIGGAILCVLLSLKNAATGEERKQMQWIVWGICIGAFPFLVFHVLPQILFSTYFMPEEFATIFFLAIPFSFSMSFLKYHFLDIEVLINRSIVYTILFLFISIAFVLGFLLVTSSLGGQVPFEDYLVIAGVSLLAAFLFVPARDGLQRILDETLFAARANFRTAIGAITEHLHKALTPDGLFRELGESIGRLVPTSRLAVYEAVEGSLRLRHSRGGSAADRIAFPQTAESWTRVALPDAAKLAGPPANPGLTRWLDEAGFSLAVALTKETGAVLGVLMLSPRIRGERFLPEEVDLITTACAHAADILERLRVQERMFLEQEERKRAQELSELKTYFVSSVSHELRMPLTSIRMFAETLRLGRVSGARQRKEYLEIIEGESERLTRLIENVLNFAKIEKGLKEYQFEEGRIEDVIRKVVKSVGYEVRAVRGKLTTRITRNLPKIRMDRDAVQQLLMNLISNALKYSIQTRQVRLTARKSGRAIVLEVADKGIGIAEKELPHIFEKFYRVRDVRSQQVGGVGLGLPLVKHVAEAHGGKIQVRSVKGKGTTVSVILPLR